MTRQREPYVRVWLDGTPVDALNRFILELEAEERADSASSFRMLLDMSPIRTRDGRGDWDVLEGGAFLEGHSGPALELMTRVTIEFSVADDPGGAPPSRATVFDGYVTCMEPRFGEDRVTDSQLEVSGLDASALMHFQTITKTWSGLTDKEIARDIFRKYGFATTDETVEDTAPARAIERGVMTQRCTDAEFLRLLARRNGFETYVEAAQQDPEAAAHPRGAMTGHFRRPRSDESPVQPELDLFPREAPSLAEFTARWESHQPTRIRGWRLDELSRLIERTDIQDPGYPRLGERERREVIRRRLEMVSFGADSGLDGGAEAGGSNAGQGPNRLESSDIFCGPTPHHAAELRAMTTSDFREADWFVNGKGVVRGERYPQIVRARRPIRVRGAGQLLDGTWYCRAACHRWARDPDPPRGQDSDQVTRRYEVDVNLVRNGLGPDREAQGQRGSASP